jgi:hypothetical protein
VRTRSSGYVNSTAVTPAEEPQISFRVVVRLLSPVSNRS